MARAAVQGGEGRKARGDAGEALHAGVEIERPLQGPRTCHRQAKYRCVQPAGNKQHWPQIYSQRQQGGAQATAAGELQGNRCR